MLSESENAAIDTSAGGGAVAGAETLPGVLFGWGEEAGRAVAGSPIVWDGSTAVAVAGIPIDDPGGALELWSVQPATSRTASPRPMRDHLKDILLQRGTECARPNPGNRKPGLSPSYDNEMVLRP